MIVFFSDKEVRMRIISWNVNGIRATKGKTKAGEKCVAGQESVFDCLLKEQVPDILCLQEVKTSNIQDLDFLKPVYPHIQFRAAEKKGYSGVALLSKQQPVSVDSPAFPTSSHAFQKEGRVITAEFTDVYVVCVYTPNSKMGLERIEERLEWEVLLLQHLTCLKRLGKAVVLCGDLNCAFSATLDIHNQKPKPGTPGLSPQERSAFRTMVEAGWIDSFRHLHPELKRYSFWSPFASARQRGVGWRLDYCIVSSEHNDWIQKADCLVDYWGSDHCPVLLDISP